MGPRDEPEDDTVNASSAIRAGIALGLTAFGAVGIAVLIGQRAYDWIKALHVIAIISWMAGMLYLPRLFIYHCDAATGSVQSETFKVMESRLLRVIINPAMIFAWVTGLWLAWQSGFYKQGWFHAKFLLVFLMSGAHGYLSASVRAFAEDRNMKPTRHWRIVNEVPTVLMIGIIVLVIVKPF